MKHLDREGWPIVPNAEIAVYAPNGVRRRAHGVVVSTEDHEKYPEGVVHYRTLGTLREGTTTCDRVVVVRKSGQYARDAVNVHGVPPSKRGRL